MSTTRIRPFDPARSVGVSGFTFEGDRESLAVYGEATITRSAEGLAAARALRDALDDVVTFLEGERDLPAAGAPARPTTPARNPFA